MVSKRLKNIRILLFLTFLVISGRVYSQVSEANDILFDTSDYVPVFYKGALDYNLMIAASKGYLTEVNRLVLKGADIFAETDQGVTPLIFAVSNNKTKVSKTLLDYGSDPNKMTLKGETPLIIAVKNGNPDIAEALIRAGAVIDTTDRYDATALHYAAVYGNFQITDMLLYYEAPVDKKTDEGSTPLLGAVWAGYADIADLLLQNGADKEARDNEGFTPFLMAAMNGDTLIMQLLYKKGADIYAVNSSKHNALDLTIIADKIEAAKYLLRLGNKWKNLGTSSISPYSVASKYRRKEMLKLLEENKIPGKISYAIDQVDFMASSRFFLHDIYTGISFSFKEPFLNGGFILGFDTKLWYTRVLTKQTEHLFYQYMHKGSLLYGGIFKDFSLTDYPFKGNFSLSTSLSAGYSFGNELKGTLKAPGNKFKVIPSVALKWSKKDLSFSLGADYIKTEFYHVGPVWLRLGASYNVFFDNVRTKGKVLKWY
jgi:ankyrin repeat protein